VRRVNSSTTTRNRVMGASRRRNAPSRMFHAVIDRGGGVQGMFQPEVVGSDASLSTVRVRAKIAADTSGLPVAVMDDNHKVIKVYRPGDGAPDTRRGVPSTRRSANMAGARASSKSIDQSKVRQAVAFSMRETGLETDDCHDSYGDPIDASEVTAWSAAHIRSYVASFDLFLTKAEMSRYGV
jgi:hypothetical protein